MTLEEDTSDTSTYSLDSTIAVLLRADVKHQGKMHGRQEHFKSSGCGWLLSQKGKDGVQHIHSLSSLLTPNDIRKLFFFLMLICSHLRSPALWIIWRTWKSYKSKWWKGSRKHKRMRHKLKIRSVSTLWHLRPSNWSLCISNSALHIPYTDCKDYYLLWLREKNFNPLLHRKLYQRDYVSLLVYKFFQHVHMKNESFIF